MVNLVFSTPLIPQTMLQAAPSLCLSPYTLAVVAPESREMALLAHGVHAHSIVIRTVFCTGEWLNLAMLPPLCISSFFPIYQKRNNETGC